MSIYASFFSWPMVDSYLNIGRHSWQSCGGGNNFHHHFIRHSTYSVRLFPNACGVFCRIRTDKQPQKDFGSIYRCGIWYHARTEMVRAIRPRPCMVLFLFRPHFSFFFLFSAFRSTLSRQPAYIPGMSRLFFFFLFRARHFFLSTLLSWLSSVRVFSMSVTWYTTCAFAVINVSAFLFRAETIYVSNVYCPRTENIQ